MVVSGSAIGARATAIRRTIRRVVRVLLQLLGSFALIALLLAFTDLPYRAHRALGTAAGTEGADPQGILLLGGGGMPSAAMLQRILWAADIAHASPEARVHIVHAADTSAIRMMRAELRLRGVADERIVEHIAGANTREQALYMAACCAPEHGTWALVTAPENCYRSLRAFRKVGFTSIHAVPAFDAPPRMELDYRYRAVGGKPYVPDVSGALDLRYDLWHQLQLELICLHEYLAIAYYAANDWI